MTVTANTTRNDYVGNGQSVYDYTFQLNDASDVTVYLDGVVQTLNTHYTVANVGVGSGGTIIFTLVDENNDPIHPTSSQAISIVMAMDLDRDTNYQQSGLFAASDVNNDFDRLWLASNQQQTAINRSLRLQDDDATTGNMELPSKDDRKGKLLGFNATTGLPETSDNNNSNWNAAYNNMITSASFSGGNYTLTQQDGGTISTSLDGRYHKIGTDIPNADISQASVTQHQGALSITESQINDLGSYLPLSGGTMSGDVEFGANKAKFVGLEIYNTIGNTSVIEETGAGNLNIKGQDVRIQTPTNEDIIKGEADGAVTLYYDNNAKLATTNTGISVTGTLSATGYNDSNWNDAYNNKITAVDYTGSTLTLTQQDGGTLTTTINGALGTSLVYNGATKAEAVATGLDVTGDISLGDNAKAKFGASDDLQIYHDGSNSYISDEGTGSLRITAQDFRVRNSANNAAVITGLDGAGVFLYHNGIQKLTTTSTGIDVTGTVTADGLTVDANTATFSAGTSGDMKLVLEADTDNNEEGDTPKIQFKMDGGNTFGHVGFAGTDGDLFTGSIANSLALGTDVNTKVQFYTFDKLRQQISNNGDISFYEDTGTTPKFFWDASAERLGIGTSSPSSALDVVGEATVGSGTYGVKLSYSNSATAGVIDTADSANKLSIRTSGTERMRIDASGKLLLNTTTHTLNDSEMVVASEYSASGTTTGGITLSSRQSGSWRNSGIFANGTSLTFTTGDTGLNGAQSSSERMRIDSNGNVGIGTSSPDARLHVVGVSSTSHVATFQSGTFQTAVYLKDTGTTSNLGFRSYDNDLSIITNGSPNFTFTDTGRLGIGTIFPADDLDIENSDGAVIRLGRGTTSNVMNDRLGAINFYNEDSSDEGPNNAVVIEGRTEDMFGSSGVLILKTNASATEGAEAGETMRLNSAGNVGIGTTSPATKLDVNGSFKASGLTYPTSDGTANQVMVTDGSGNLSFVSRSLWTGLTYIGSNNVVLSQSTPSGNTSTAKLNVFKYNSGTTPDSDSTVFFDSSGNNVLQLGSGNYNTSAINFGNGFNASKGRIEVNQGSGHMAFKNNYSERVRITSTGDLLVGTTTFAAKITAHAGGSSVSTPFGTIIQGRDTSSNAYLQLASHYMGAAGIYLGDSGDVDRAGVSYSNYSDRLDFNANASTRMSINSSGYVGINTTAPAVPLDINGNKLRIRDSFTPSSASSSGNKGDICYDSNYMYVCVAANTWKRAALASW